MQAPKKQTSAATAGACLAALMMLTAAPWAAAQTEPGAADTAPQPKRINRNPAFRAQLPEAPPPPADPRDSTTRPVTPPGSSDGRDTVLPAPGQATAPGTASSAPRKP